LKTLTGSHLFLGYEINKPPNFTPTGIQITMKLSYRTVSYDYTPLSLEATEKEILGKYRGVVSHCHTLKEMPVPQPDMQLTYRGVSYHTDPTVVERCRTAVRSDARQVTCPIGVMRTLAVRKAMEEVHRSNLLSNLERRLQSARERGDTRLVELLEAESKQLVGM
jgi:hypothetical protein